MFHIVIFVTKTRINYYYYYYYYYDSDLDEKAMPDVGIILNRSTEHPSADDVANEAFVDEAGKGESDSITDREPCVQLDEVLPEENDLLDPGT